MIVMRMSTAMDITATFHSEKDPWDGWICAGGPSGKYDGFISVVLNDIVVLLQKRGGIV